MASIPNIGRGLSSLFFRRIHEVGHAHGVELLDLRLHGCEGVQDNRFLHLLCVICLVQAHDLAGLGREEKTGHDVGFYRSARLFQFLHQCLDLAGEARREVEDGAAPENGPCLNVLRSNRVTIPRLFPPPLSATNRSEFSFWLGLTNLPEASTTS